MEDLVSVLIHTKRQNTQVLDSGGENGFLGDPRL